MTSPPNSSGIRAEQRIRSGTAAWWPPEVSTGHRLVFVRRGVFGLRLRGWDASVDPVTAFAVAPGDELSIAHRVDARDVCTVLGLDRPMLTDLTAGSGRLPDRPVVLDGRAQLGHRLLVRQARRHADRFALAEQAVRLAAAVLHQPAGFASTTTASARVHRRIVQDARDLLVAAPVGLSLSELARRVGVSTHHLSRIFRRHTGQTLSRFRAQLRINRALDRIEAGELDLARLAADLGFADHAHFTRTLHTHVGYPPTVLRRLLAESGHN